MVSRVSDHQSSPKFRYLRGTMIWHLPLQHTCTMLFQLCRHYMTRPNLGLLSWTPSMIITRSSTMTWLFTPRLVLSTRVKRTLRFRTLVVTVKVRWYPSYVRLTLRSDNVRNDSSWLVSASAILMRRNWVTLLICTRLLMTLATPS